MRVVLAIVAWEAARPLARRAVYAGLRAFWAWELWREESHKRRADDPAGSVRG